LQSWHQAHRFQDPNRAVRLHLLGAVLFEKLDRLDTAAELIHAAQDYQPSDTKLAAQLRNATQFMKSRQQLSSGTGFVIDDSGLILTNYHVVAGAGRTTVRINDAIPPLAAEVVGTDQTRDLALLKIPVPAGTKLTAIRLADRTPRRGEQVAAFGYPLGDSLGTGLKLTRGVISGSPDPSNDNLLLLDLTINPGNSGGPLCDSHGNVVGMVTAKSASDRGVDSYGMAIPSADLVTFAKQHLPDYQPTKPAQDTATKAWEEVDQMISPSVFIVLQLK
jgi:S1-C subfamily serine protease